MKIESLRKIPHNTRKFASVMTSERWKALRFTAYRPELLFSRSAFCWYDSRTLERLCTFGGRDGPESSLLTRSAGKMPLLYDLWVMNYRRTHPANWGMFLLGELMFGVWYLFKSALRMAYRSVKW